MSTKAISKKKNQKYGKYMEITQNQRIDFLDLVCLKRCPIKIAASQAGLKYESAKLILRTYLQEGRIGKKQKRQKALALKNFHQKVFQLNRENLQAIKSINNDDIFQSYKIEMKQEDNELQKTKDSKQQYISGLQGNIELQKKQASLIPIACHFSIKL